MIEINTLIHRQVVHFTFLGYGFTHSNLQIKELEKVIRPKEGVNLKRINENIIE